MLRWPLPLKATTPPTQHQQRQQQVQEGLQKAQDSLVQQARMQLVMAVMVQGLVAATATAARRQGEAPCWALVGCLDAARAHPLLTLLPRMVMRQQHLLLLPLLLARVE